MRLNRRIVGQEALSQLLALPVGSRVEIIRRNRRTTVDGDLNALQGREVQVVKYVPRGKSVLCGSGKLGDVTLDKPISLASGTVSRLLVKGPGGRNQGITIGPRCSYFVCPTSDVEN